MEREKPRNDAGAAENEQILSDASAALCGHEAISGKGLYSWE